MVSSVIDTSATAAWLPPRQQRGAALVIGMILLLVLTLLAIAGMNSASMEFIMAGNDQYQQNSFQAAETGVEQALANGAFNTNMVATQVAGPVPNSATDNYQATITQVTPNLIPLPGNSNGGNVSIGAFFYRINSSGTSVRSSSANSVQGAFVVAPGGGP